MNWLEVCMVSQSIEREHQVEYGMLTFGISLIENY